MSKPLKLKMEFETNNPCVRSFNRIFCGWGMRKTPYDEKGNFKGQTAPLWANPSLIFFLAVFIVNLILSLLFIGCFIGVRYTMDKNDETKDCENKKDYKNEFIIIGSIILLVNSFYWLFLYLKKYASDQEWSRYMIFLVILWAALVGFTIAELIVTADSIKKYKKLDKGKCKDLFLANICVNMIVGICNGIVSIIVIVMVFIISKNLFFMKYVPHTASCEDEDIIIIE